MIIPFSSVILASQSIARKALLESVGLKVITHPTYVDESHSFDNYKEAVREIALRKLFSYVEGRDNLSFPVIAADTMISIHSQILGKPIDKDDARRQLAILSGNRHSVCSGYAVYLPFLGRIYSGFDETFVNILPLTKQQIEEYLDTGEYVGAAASYRIQEKGRAIISSVDGDITTVVGLPMMKISAILTEPENLTYQEYPPHGEN
ncbi:MAG: Maf-like protein [Spirochaetia bacterium]|nr:Maf-like protein [Spirochaetia bacterium]